MRRSFGNARPAPNQPMALARASFRKGLVMVRLVGRALLAATARKAWGSRPTRGGCADHGGQSQCQGGEEEDLFQHLVSLWCASSNPLYAW